MPEPGTKTVVDKRKPAKSLAQQLRQQLTWLGLLLLLAFNAVIFGFILYTIDSSTDIVLELEARAIADQLRREPHKPLPRYKSLSAYQKWLDIPATLRLKISPSGQVIREPRLIKDQSANDEPMYIHYLPHHSDDVGDIYIISQHPLADVQNTIGAVISRVLSQAFWLATSIVWVLFICVAWLFRQTSAPLSLLSQWAEQLGKSPQQAREINFPIAELNQLAAQLRHGVEQEHAYNLREQMFLKQASHELRTPLATIRASLDTLALDQTASSKPIIQRAINSSEKIELLSKALLWLCSDTDQPLAKHRFNPAQMCRELYGQLQPLFQRNSHAIEMQLEECEIELEREMLNMVLANLIRNALQHSDDGPISLSLTANQFSIRNTIAEPDQHKPEQHSTGFGLGLKLVQKVCQKLGWQYRSQLHDNSLNATVSWP